MTPELVNVVGGGDLNTEIKLEEMYEKISAPICKYEPEMFSGLYIQFEEGGPTVMLFSSGKYNIAGAKTTGSLYRSHAELVETMAELGIDLIEEQIELEVRNRVYVDSYESEIDLEGLLPDLGFENTEYDPETFPGLMYRPQEGGFLAIFRSGKMMITGLKDAETSKQILQRVKDRLSELFSNDL